MKTIILALIICATVAGLTFFGLNLIGVDKDIAKVAATLILSTFPKLRDLLDKLYAERQGDVMPDLIKDFFSYKVHPAQTFLYTSIIGYAAIEIGSFFGGLIAGMLSSDLGGAAAATGVIVIIFSLPILYLCGHWIGRRCSSYPYLIAIAAGITIRAVAYYIDPLFVSAEHVKEFLADEQNFLIHFVPGAIIYSVLMVVGVFFGIKQQLTAYCGYLLHKLPRDSRVALVDLAHDEALKISRAAKLATI